MQSGPLRSPLAWEVQEVVKPAWTLSLVSSIKSHQHTSNTSGKQLSCIAKTMLQDASRDTRTKAKQNLRSGMATMSPDSQVHSPAKEPRTCKGLAVPAQVRGNKLGSISPALPHALHIIRFCFCLSHRFQLYIQGLGLSSWNIQA